MKNIFLLRVWNNLRGYSLRGDIYFKICLQFYYLTIYNIYNKYNNNNIKLLTSKNFVGKICLQSAYNLPTAILLEIHFAYKISLFAYILPLLPTYFAYKFKNILIYISNYQYQLKL